MAGSDQMPWGKPMPTYHYDPLSPEDIDRIHNSALEVLEKVGLRARGTVALEVFIKHGARIDGDTVRIPRQMVDDALQATPSLVTLYGREERHHLRLTGRECHLGTGGAALRVIDLESPRPRSATLEDVSALAALVDRLDHIEFYLRPAIPQDIPRNVADLNTYYACLLHTTKHVMGSVDSLETFRRVRELGSIVAGSADSLREKPFLSFITCWMRSPLSLDPRPTEIMLEIVRCGLPVVLSSAPMTGSTAPVTLAGCLVQLHAEILSGAVLTQLVNPGSPVIYGYVPSIANPSTLEYLGGSAEFGLLNAAAVQLAASLGLPNYSSAGLTDSKLPDAQAGVEKVLSLLLVAQAGGNYIHHAAGMLESMLTVAYGQYVIDDDILGMVARIRQGIAVNEDTLAGEVIAKVGPGGNYLAQKHTVKHLRKEHHFPRVMDRDSRKVWEAKGTQDTFARANQRARALLAEGTPHRLPDAVIAEIKSHLKEVIR